MLTLLYNRDVIWYLQKSKEQHSKLENLVEHLKEQEKGYLTLLQNMLVGAS